jgi:hypothetical protein
MIVLIWPKIKPEDWYCKLGIYLGAPKVDIGMP